MHRHTHAGCCGSAGWEIFATGAEAADALLALSGPAPIEKAVNPLSRPGYEAAVRSMLRAIRRETHAADTAAVARAAARMEARWTSLSAAQIDRVIAAASESLLAVPEIVTPGVEKVLYEKSGKLIEATKRASVREHSLRIGADFGSRDEAIAAYARDSAASYVTDAYGRRAEIFSERTRKIVSSGIERGLDNATIGAELQAAITNPLMRKAASYWESVASIHTARARSWGLLASFDEAAIQWFTWFSQLDEVTTEMCRFLHGRRFSVARAVQRYMQVAESEEPEAVKVLQPWLRTGKTVDGREYIFADAGGRRTLLAQVDEPAYGKRDAVGSYSRVASSERIESVGCTTPPAHPRCRSTMQPD